MLLFYTDPDQQTSMLLFHIISESAGDFIAEERGQHCVT